MFKWFLSLIFPVKFMNHNVMVWEYLGFANPHYFHGDEKVKGMGCYVYFFEHKKTKKRSFYVDYKGLDAYDRNKMDRHPYIKLTIGLWKLGQYEHGQMIDNTNKAIKVTPSTPPKKVVRTDNVIKVDFGE